MGAVRKRVCSNHQGCAMIHDTSKWSVHFRKLLRNPEVNIVEHFRTNWLPLYWLMRIDGPALEVGCGTARACVLLKRLQPWRQVAGLDIDPQVCAVAREYVKAAGVDVQIHEGDAFNLPFHDGEFAVTFSSGLFEHYPDEQIVAGLGEQLRVARATLVSVPTEHYYFVRGQPEYGDEREIKKLVWVDLFTRAGDIAELSFSGDAGQEMTVNVVIVRSGAKGPWSYEIRRG